MPGTESKESNQRIFTFFIQLTLREAIYNEIYEILGVYNKLFA